MGKKNHHQVSPRPHQHPWKLAEGYLIDLEIYYEK